MTIRRTVQETGATAAEVVCNTCDKLLYIQFQGYGADAPPLERSTLQQAGDTARQHDKGTRRGHLVIETYFTNDPSAVEAALTEWPVKTFDDGPEEPIFPEDRMTTFEVPPRQQPKQSRRALRESARKFLDLD